jgi:hypothetical protein
MGNHSCIFRKRSLQSVPIIVLPTPDRVVVFLSSMKIAVLPQRQKHICHFWHEVRNKERGSYPKVEGGGAMRHVNRTGGSPTGATSELRVQRTRDQQDMTFFRFSCLRSVNTGDGLKVLFRLCLVGVAKMKFPGRNPHVSEMVSRKLRTSASGTPPSCVDRARRTNQAQFSSGLFCY